MSLPVTRMTRACQVAIGLSILVIVIATLYPFRLVPSALYGLPVTLRVFFNLTTTYAGDIGSNLLLFMPLGAALFGLWLNWPNDHPNSQPQPRLRLALWHILKIGLVLSAGVEAVQFLIPSRTSSLADIVVNGLGAVLGAIALAAIHRVFTTPVTQPGWLAWPGRAFILLCWLLLCLGTTHFLNHQSALTNWDASYELNIGHSGRTNHPWQGRIEEILWLDRVVAPSSQRPPALFHYQAGQVQMSVEPKALRDRLEATSEFTLQTQFATNRLEGKALSSLFAFSRDIWHSNFVLARSGTDLRVLCRTPITKKHHQRWIYLTLPRLIQDTELHELTLTYKNAVLQAYWDGQLQSRTMNLRADRILLHYLLPLKLSKYRLTPWGEAMTRLLFYGVWMIPVGLLLTSLRHPLSRQAVEIRLVGCGVLVLSGLAIAMLWQQLLLPEPELEPSLLPWILPPFMLGGVIEVVGAIQLRRFRLRQLKLRQLKPLRSP